MDNGAAKDEFSRVQGYAIPTAHVKPLHGLVEAIGDTIRPEQGVVDAFRVVAYPRDNLVVSASVAVARRAIRSDTVAVTSPRRDERRKVFIVIVQVHAVIPIPSVEHRLNYACSWGHRAPDGTGMGCGGCHVPHIHLMPESPMCILACHSFWHKSPFGGSM